MGKKKKHSVANEPHLDNLKAIYANGLQLGDRFVWLHDGASSWETATLLSVTGDGRILVGPSDGGEVLRIPWMDVVYVLSDRTVDWHEGTEGEPLT